MNKAPTGGSTDDSTDEPRVAVLPPAGGAEEPRGEEVRQADPPPAANATPEADTPGPVEAALSRAGHSANALRAAAIAGREDTAPAHPVEASATAPAPAGEEKARAADAEPPSAVPVEDTHEAAATEEVALVEGTHEATAPEEVATVEHGIGVLLVNLGTPDAADRKAVHRYLKEFLSDRRVIERNSLFWQAVLSGVILPLRSRRRARDYRKIWNHEKDESPFKTITRAQAEKLAVGLEPFGEHVIVDWAMRYASPSIRSRLETLIRRGCDRILIMPLYPQYSAATTATACDEVFRYMMSLRWQPALRILPPYYAEPHYIEALASSLAEALKDLSYEPDVILASYHGMPREFVDKGDPYQTQCARTTELLRQQLGLDENKLMMSFQSRFGRGLWLEPYTIKTVKALAKRGVKNLAVITPGFSADCLETLEEIAVENARMFRRHGGKNFAVIPCLNDGNAGMQLIRQLAMSELKGWL
jgi:protoporphyrin/coproporphyrin ferrochelatase